MYIIFPMFHLSSPTSRNVMYSPQNRKNVQIHVLVNGLFKECVNSRQVTLFWQYSYTYWRFYIDFKNAYMAFKTGLCISYELFSPSTYFYLKLVGLLPRVMVGSNSWRLLICFVWWKHFWGAFLNVSLVITFWYILYIYLCYIYVDDEHKIFTSKHILW